MPNKFKVADEKKFETSLVQRLTRSINTRAERYVSNLETNLKDEIHYDAGVLHDAISVDIPSYGTASIYIDRGKVLSDSRNLEGFDYTDYYWKGRPATVGIINEGSKWGDAGSWRAFKRWNGDPFVERAVERTKF